MNDTIKKFSYYTIIPYLTDKTVIGELDFSGGIHLYLLACLVNYAAILIGFYSSVKVSSFSKFNNYISVNNAKEIGLILMFIAISVLFTLSRLWTLFTTESREVISSGKEYELHPIVFINLFMIIPIFYFLYKNVLTIAYVIP